MTTEYIYKKEISPSVQEMDSATLGAPWPLQGRRSMGPTIPLSLVLPNNNDFPTSQAWSTNVPLGADGLRYGGRADSSKMHVKRNSTCKIR